MLEIIIDPLENMKTLLENLIEELQKNTLEDIISNVDNNSIIEKIKSEF